MLIMRECRKEALEEGEERARERDEQEVGV